MVPKTRLRGKQRAPAQFMLPAASYQALVAESWSELTALSEDARRRHVHWVHVRTHNPEHKQPDQFARA
eukprot:2721633-Karenia_brevis.AAC.1